MNAVMRQSLNPVKERKNLTVQWPVRCTKETSGKADCLVGVRESKRKRAARCTKAEMSRMRPLVFSIVSSTCADQACRRAGTSEQNEQPVYTDERKAGFSEFVNLSHRVERSLQRLAFLHDGVFVEQTVISISE